MNEEHRTNPPVSQSAGWGEFQENRMGADRIV